MMLSIAFFSGLLDFLKNYTEKFIATIVIIIICTVLLIILKTIVKSYTKRLHGKRKHALTLARMISSVVRYSIYIIGGIVIISAWGIDVTPILAGAGIIALGVSLGAQKLISDLISGMCIVFENYYDIDDVVEINGFKGTVIEIGLKSTKLMNWKNEVKIIPNGNIGDVTNFSQGPSVGFVEVDIAYHENIDKVIALLEEKLVQLRDVFPQIMEGPNVTGVTSLSDSSVKIGIVVKTEPEKHYEVVRAINKFVKNLFDQENVEIPFPQLVVHNDDDNK